MSGTFNVNMSQAQLIDRLQADLARVEAERDAARVQANLHYQGMHEIAAQRDRAVAETAPIARAAQAVIEAARKERDTARFVWGEGRRSEDIIRDMRDAHQSVQDAVDALDAALAESGR